MRPLPSGTVTFLFSDIEGSTRLLDELGAERYAAALAEHRRVMREAFALHGGVEVDTQGDAFFAAFPEADGALAAAAQAQAGLAEGSIRVRIGLHSGQPLVTAEGYVGIDVHRGARVMSAGHGGQVLVSQATYALLDGAGELTQLGRHRLKDLTEPQPLYQLGDGDFPPLKTLYQTNLPVQPTALVGREAELSDVLELLSGSRLLTLTGAGGSGKTRLALQAAAELVDDYRDGVWWVSLAALRDPALVEPTIGQTVGAKDGLADHLRGKQMLLLLDNFEQLVPAGRVVVALLSEAPDVRVLVTSRERLGLSAEQEYPVPTLVPAEAVALFTARARQLKPAFEPDEQVEAICSRLDGLPLALELAAARVKVLTPEQIFERLRSSLELLTGGARDAPERQQTLRATIAWSYGLLDDREKQLFARLAVFAGSFDLEAAEAVCDVELETLAALVDKSLLRQTDEGRFFMLETIREFAAVALDESGDAHELRERHAEYFLALAEDEDAGGAHEARWLRLLEPELDNLRAAYGTAVGVGNADIALRLTGALHPFWYHTSRFSEGLDWATQALLLGGEPRSRQKAVAAAAELALMQGELEEARMYAERNLELCLQLDDPLRLAIAHTLLGHVAAAEHDASTAVQHYEHCLGLLEGGQTERSSWLTRAVALNNLGWAMILAGNTAEGEKYLEDGVVAAQSEGGQLIESALLLNLVHVSIERGDFTSVRARLTEALSLLREATDRRHLAEALDLLARALARTDEEGSARLQAAAAQLREDIGLGLVEPLPDDASIADARTRLGDHSWKAAEAKGRADEDPLELAFQYLRRLPIGAPSADLGGG
jgi:predicted ATPase